MGQVVVCGDGFGSESEGGTVGAQITSKSPNFPTPHISVSISRSSRPLISSLTSSSFNIPSYLSQSQFSSCGDSRLKNPNTQNISCPFFPNITSPFQWPDPASTYDHRGGRLQVSPPGIPSCIPPPLHLSIVFWSNCLTFLLFWEQ